MAALSPVAIVSTERKGKTDRNDWDTACGNFKTSISNLTLNLLCLHQKCRTYGLFFHFYRERKREKGAEMPPTERDMAVHLRKHLHPADLLQECTR
jgi:hypothetical protein